ncbi:sigma-70 family RNA polymerase sigma factor [Pseudomonas sp. S37]|nr:sigma-70 family RNA polymerase sigma factor [Pseudomonas sp. S37]
MQINQALVIQPELQAFEHLIECPLVSPTSEPLINR